MAVAVSQMPLDFGSTIGSDTFGVHSTSLGLHESVYLLETDAMLRAMQDIATRFCNLMSQQKKTQAKTTVHPRLRLVSAIGQCADLVRPNPEQISSAISVSLKSKFRLVLASLRGCHPEYRSHETTQGKHYHGTP